MDKFNATTPSLVVRGAERYGNKPAISYLNHNGEADRISFNELKELVDSLARGFISYGFERGDKVLLFEWDSPEWILAHLGIQRAGGIPVPLTPDTQSPSKLKNNNMAFIAEHSDSKYAIVSQSIVEQFEGYGLKGIIPITNQFSPKEDYGSNSKKNDFNSLIQRGMSSKASLPYMTEEEIGELVYTSGTSGSYPKGVMLSHLALVSNAVMAAETFGLTENDSIMVIAPRAHTMGGVGGERAPLYAGSEIIVQPSLRELMNETFLYNFLERFSPSVFVSAPRFYEVLYEKLKKKNEKLLERYNYPVLRDFLPMFLQTSIGRKVKEHIFRKKMGGKIRCFVSGSSPFSEELANAFKDLGLQIIEGYGLTEYAPVVSCNHPGKHKIGSVGKPIKRGIWETQVKIAEDGEILVKGPSIMSGYYKDPEATKEAIVDGWLHTGDLGFLGEEDYLFITGRKKRSFKPPSGEGEFVQPEALECVLKGSDHIDQVLVGRAKDRENCEIAIEIYSKVLESSEEAFEEVKLLLANQTPLVRRLVARGGPDCIYLREKPFEITEIGKIRLKSAEHIEI